jgi:GT2 family glycosyltransferase
MAVTRPAFDVVIPFRGSPAELDALRGRLEPLTLREGDSVLVVDNTPGHGGQDGPVPVLPADAVSTPGFARNQGAAVGDAEWLLFLDADVVPPPDLLDRYFEPPPDERTALVAGEVEDEPVPVDGPPAARYAQIRGLLSHDSTLKLGRWGFPNTANLACRRAAFEAVGGFREDIRAAEDGDLAFRIREGGWGLERRTHAAVLHRSRPTVRAFIAQKAYHGAGAAWLDDAYPGAHPSRSRAGLVWWGVRCAVAHLVRALLSHDRDTAIWGVFGPLEELSLEFGRSLPNERPLPPGSLWARLLDRRPRVR